ncbi:MAG: hypothetical protein ONB12_14275 [candidate division KSB1 bacterium]|nr:hypothetical protein [candidate division KSB1 bacterium]
MKQVSDELLDSGSIERAAPFAGFGQSSWALREPAGLTVVPRRSRMRFAAINYEQI